ncbi:MAG: ABC transporter ATP-binding protein [Treponema sp.]|nr:ABC transporter ATP-binding protein [Treponema sp.]
MSEGAEIMVKRVSKRYGRVLACDDVSLLAMPGEMTVLLGPNGAGKSTLIKSICALLRFEGVITIGGHDNRSIEAKRLLGYVPETPAVYPMLTVWEHLEFIAKAYSLRDWKDPARDLISRFDLDDKRDKLGRDLSKGMQQKVCVCCALLPRPGAVIMDEPLVGLDPHGIRELKIVTTELKRSGCALLVSTHIIDSVEDDWDVTCVMKGGRIVAACRRSEMPEGRTLEDVYFSTVESEEGL